MYAIFIENKKTQKKINDYIKLRKDVGAKLDRLSFNPFRETGAHPLRGKLKKRWACWLGSNIRMMYRIDVKNKLIIVEAIGTHKIY